MNRTILSTSSSGLDNLDINHPVGLIRLRIHINNVEFIDGKNIAIERLSYLMDQEGTSAIYTSPAPANEVREQFLRLQQQGCKEIFITSVSSKLSESFKIISEVAAEFKKDMDMDIYVYDCKDLNICEAFLALEAAALTKQGASMDDIARKLDSIRAGHRMYYAVQDASYLIKNNKMSNTAGFFINMLNIKLILEVTDTGLLVPGSKIRHYRNALDYLVTKFVEASQYRNTFVYLLSPGKAALEQHLTGLIQEKMGDIDVPILPMSAISIANHGPTGIGVCYFKGELPQVSAKFRGSK